MKHLPGIGYWIAKAAYMHPDRTALVTPEGRLSYGRLAERVVGAAELLGRHGIGAGDRFGILMHNDARFLELLFAAGRTGAIAVPLNWRLTPHELAHPVRDAGLTVVFVGPEPREAGVALAASCGVELVTVPEAYDAVVDDVVDRVRQARRARSPFQTDYPGDDDPVLMVYTSGTTGRPKGAVLTHGNMFWNAINDILALGLTYRDTTLTLLPLMHVGGIGLFTLPTLLAGGTVVMPRGFDAAQALRLIEEERVTLFLGVPAVHAMLVQSPGFGAAKLDSLRLVYNGGDRCPLPVMEAYRDRGLAFGAGYGLTETSPTAYLTELDQLEAGAGREGFVGKPSFGLDARLVREDGVEAVAGEVGEVLVRGPGVFREYWGLPDRTLESFTDGWFHTGDLAVRDDEGFTVIVDRKKQMLKSGGENIYPAEVEQTLREHPAVAEAVVIGRSHPKWNEVPFAVVTLHPGAVADADELQAFCAERLARFKVPAGFALVDSLPRTSIGKPNRALLAERYGIASGAST
jgi:fatty-acyl-CoA synthase